MCDNMSRTSMQISKETLHKLYNIKEFGESYEDVILRLLQIYEKNK